MTTLKLTVEELTKEGTVRVPEASRFLSVSRGTVWGMVRTGELPSVKLNGARLIPRAALQKILAENLVGAAD